VDKSKESEREEKIHEREEREREREAEAHGYGDARRGKRALWRGGSSELSYHAQQPLSEWREETTRGKNQK
jgi:hypothetical protein